MKHYSMGVIKCKCSKAMKRGKFIKVYNFCQWVFCPNCKVKRLVPVKMVSIRKYVSAKISRKCIGSKLFKIERGGD